MTKKLTSTQLPNMELDLDAFLNSNSTSDSDSDSDSHSIPHRTLDEILNDSSPSPSPPSSLLSRKPPPFSSEQIPRSLSDAVSLDSTPPLDSSSLPQTQQFEDEKPDRSKANNGSFVRAKSAAGFSGDPIWRVPSSSSSNSRPLPSLFGGVRSNAKPGAALAAAAAASRSVPTPHAAAIKSRRATSIAGSLRMVGVGPGESGSSVAGDDHEIVSVSSSNGGGSSVGGVEKSNSGERLLEENDGVSDYQSGVDNEISVAKSSNLENSTEEHSVELSSSILDSKAENENENENLIATATDDNLELSGANDSGEVDFPSASWMDEKDGKKEEDSTLSPPVEGDALEKDVEEGEGDDVSSMSDVSELVAERLEQLESEMISRRAEKKMRSIMKPLELAEEHEKRQASTGLHLEEGAAAQPMRLEGVKRGSTTLGYFDTDTNNVITRAISSQGFMRDHGSPQVLAISLNHVAVGMSKGVIIVVPSRHSPHASDTMDAKMMMLGGQGDRSHSPVTSMCFNQQGDLLLAGYADGHITVWEVLRASPARVITGEHTAPVVHTLFLGQDSQVTRQFKAVTGDSKGLVLLHSFSVVPLLNRFNIKTQCLLDGQRTGTVLSASPLRFEESTGGGVPSSQGNAPVPSSSIGSMMGGVVGGESGWKLFNEGSSLGEEGVVVFATFQTALVVRLSPTLQIYAQLAKPDGVREGSMPYTAWKSTVLSSDSSTDNVSADAAERVSLLAVAWDRKVQVAKLVKSELKVYGKWSLDSTAIGVTWLDSHMLVVLTSTGQLYLFAKDGTVIHQTSFLLDVSGGDELVAYHTHFLNVFGNPEKAYHNSIAVRGASIYILGPMRLIVSRLLPWKERIQVLRRAGDWMGALNMAMTLYDGQAHGVIDLPRSLDAVQETIMPYLVELLFSYVDEVFSYISVAFCNQIGKVEQEDDSKSGSNSVRSEIKEQYTRVGGVAVELCVHIQRTDILFDEIFSRFLAVQQRDTFLELLEPYILKDMLGSLPPEIMQALVEHYSSKGWLQRVEQCVLHMDISSLDFNQVVRLCREHGLYSALVYLFNKGLDDFRAPLEELLMVWQNSPSESAAALGYKMLIYLKYCFLGLAFPPGRGRLPAERLPSLRTELVHFLLENSENLNSQAKSISSFRGLYWNLYHLLELDTEATLDVLRCAFVDDEQENVMTSSSQNLLAQNTVDALIPIIEGKMLQADHSMSNKQAWPSKKDIGHIFEYISFYVACKKACVTKGVLSQILEYLTSESDSHPDSPARNIQPLKKKEKQMLALLESVPETDWNPSYVLQLCEKAHFHQVCGLIHTVRHQYLAALDSYLKDVDEPIHIFAYINNTLQELHNNDYDSFRSAVMSRIPEMLVLSREGTFFLVIEHFNNASSYILSGLQSHPKSLFLYLKTVVEVYLSGTLNFSYLVKNDYADAFDGRTAKDQSKGLDVYLQRISDFPKIIRSNPVQVTDDMIELYLELLCQYERNSVLNFLETFDSYRVEHCLRLCQEYGIVDAAAFLLERVGDVGSALSLMLSGFNDKFPELDTAVGSLVSDKPLSGPSSVRHYSAVLKLKEVDEIRSILHACIGLCRRNTPRLRPEESETLWFRLLDSFCDPLMDSSADKGSSSESNHSGMVSENFGSPDDDESCIIKWRISKFHKNARILRKLFSQFIKEIVEGMIGYVRLPTIMSKLLSDNGSQEFGDFKNTILGMLGTYGFERRILDTAKSLIEDDTFYTMNVLKKGASHGYAPRSLECCICNCLLTKTSSSLGIRVFSCGHATHLQCELESESSSRGSLSGCPVCMPKKNTQWPRNKSVHEHGLVNKISTRMKRAQGAGVFHPHDESSSESSYGLQQISRFEFLANLQKDQRLAQVENMPQLKLAPPAVYHEKVKKGSDLLVGASSSNLEGLEKASRKLREPKGKGSSLRFPLKSSIFGKEKTNKR